MPTLRVALVFSLLIIATPLIAQVQEKLPPANSETQATVQNPSQEPAEASEPARKLRIISEGQTLNYIPKFDGSGPTGLTDSILFENNGKVGINTNDPKTLLHLYGAATSDVPIGLGPDPTYLGGPAFNIGYAGASFGRSVGFLNVRPDALAVAPNPSLRFLTADVTRMIITNTGAVGLGTIAPAARLHIEADTFNPGAGQSTILIKSASNQDAILGLGVGPNFSDNVDGFVVAYNGNAGVGRAWIGTRPTSGTGQITFAVKNVTEMLLTSTGLNVTDALNVGGNLVATGSITASAASNSTNITGGTIQLQGNPTKLTFGNGQFIQDNNSANMRIYAGANLSVDTNAGGDITMVPGSTNFRVTGNVVASNSATIGPSGGDPTISRFVVNGSAHFNGRVTGNNIQAHYQDVAEWVPATSDLTPGTVVILNRGRNNEVMASATAYDTAVAGVVSAQPGISLGVEGEGKEQIATTGRVKVRVDARRRSVVVGDLLVTSTTPGMAMRSEPMEIGGHSFHKPGTIIGKALEPLAGGVGEILVLLSMQ